MITIIIPTLNGGELFRNCLESIREQVLQPAEILVMDSLSTDRTVMNARNMGCAVVDVAPGTFNHGGTRTLGAQMTNDPILVFMTQDAVLADSFALKALCSVFEDPSVEVAFGRQLPHKDANPIATHARLFNYPKQSYKSSRESATPRGIRKAFNSNSFAAYRRSALENVGWFPSDVILGEDFIVAAQIILGGGTVAYVSESTVYHSHNYTLSEEASRSFDIGVFHSQIADILDFFGNVEKTGVAYAIAQLKWVQKNGSFYWVVRSFMTSLARCICYRLGQIHNRLPESFVHKLCMHKGFFDKRNSKSIRAIAKG